MFKCVCSLQARISMWEGSVCVHVCKFSTSMCVRALVFMCVFSISTYLCVSVCLCAGICVFSMASLPVYTKFLQAPRFPRDCHTGLTQAGGSDQSRFLLSCPCSETGDEI